jgi:hypothetical protein
MKTFNPSKSSAHAAKIYLLRKEAISVTRVGDLMIFDHGNHTHAIKNGRITSKMKGNN